MATHTRILTTTCPQCESPMQRVSIKSPHIDDYADDCSNTACPRHGEALAELRASARAYAEAEARADAQEGGENE